MKKEYYKPTVAVMSIFSQTIMGASDDFADPTFPKDQVETHAPGRRLYI